MDFIDELIKEAEYFLEKRNYQEAYPNTYNYSELKKAGDRVEKIIDDYVDKRVELILLKKGIIQEPNHEQG